MDLVLLNSVPLVRRCLNIFTYILSVVRLLLYYLLLYDIIIILHFVSLLLCYQHAQIVSVYCTNISPCCFVLPLPFHNLFYAFFSLFVRVWCGENRLGQSLTNFNFVHDFRTLKRVAEKIVKSTMYGISVFATLVRAAYTCQAWLVEIKWVQWCRHSMGFRPKSLIMFACKPRTYRWNYGLYHRIQRHQIENRYSIEITSQRLWYYLHCVINKTYNFNYATLWFFRSFVRYILGIVTICTSN